MNREINIDIARSLSIIYICGIYHLLDYTGIHINGYIVTHVPTATCLRLTALGVFTFISAYLISSKYSFNSFLEVVHFYKRRLIRIYPLFLLASILFLFTISSWESIRNGLLLISPFIKPRALTLWYIPTIIIFYILTPLFLNRKIHITILNSTCIFIIVGFFYCLFKEVDLRFLYYFVAYIVGVIVAKYYPPPSLDKVLTHKSCNIYSVLWLIALLITLFVDNVLFVMVIGYLGIFAILSLSTKLSNSGKINKWEGFINFISYGSMAAYLFHRIVYYLFLKIWAPNTSLGTGVYLFLIAFPIMLITSFYIQKIYDLIINRLSYK